MTDPQQIILVTGATGLLGSHLVQALIQTQAKVKALYRSVVPSFDGADKVEWLRGDILDITSLEEAMQGVHQVYHCAGFVSFNPAHKHQLFKINVEGTANVVNACLTSGVQKLLFVSSVAALGKLRTDATVNETMNWTKETGNSTYGQTKYLAEMEVWRAIGEGLQAVIVNPVIILGAGDWSKGSAGLFKSAYDEFPWYTEGISGFVDVADVVKAMVLLMNSSMEAQRFIISAENISFKELFTRIAVAFGKKPPQKKVTPFLAEIVWRLEAIKGKFSGKEPMLNKETASTALATVFYDNNKLLKALPDFTYRPLTESIQHIVAEIKQRYR